MLRICIGLGAMLLFTGCEKYWRGLHIEKRIYRDGYYVHLPWKRYTPKNEYPKPEPYPVDHSRMASTDTTQKYAGGVADSVGQKGERTEEPEGSSGTQNSIGAGGIPASSQGSVGQVGGSGGYGYSAPAANAPPGNAATGYPSPAPSSPPVTYASPPALQPEEVVDPPLPNGHDSLLPDSAIAQNDSVLIPTDSVASNNAREFPEGEFSLYTELGFYNSFAGNSYAVKPLSYNAGGGIRYSIHPWSRHKISSDAGIFVSCISIRQDQRKTSPLFSEPHGKERITQLKLRFMLMDHVYITRNATARVDAVELGLFADIGLFSTHVAVDYHGNDDQAAMTRSKTRLYELKYLRTFQYGITLRVSNEKWSVFANYRCSSLLKAGPNGGDLPRLVIGLNMTLRGNQR